MTRTSCTIFWSTLLLAVSLGLYHTSYQVDSLTHELRSLDRQIRQERQNIHVLRAEWVYLTNPARIESVARKHLDLEPTQTNRIFSLRKLRQLLPTRSESLAGSAPEERPMASLRTRAAAPTPEAARDEDEHLNTYLVIQGAKETKRMPSHVGFRLASDETYSVGSHGGAP